MQPTNDAAMTPPPVKTVKNFAERAALLRFPLLLLIVAVHARHRPDMALAAPDSFFNHPFIRFFPHAAVPCFFLISGFFLCWSLKYGQFFDYPKLLRRKMYTLLLPYFLWNSVFFFLHSLLPKLLQNSSLLPEDKFAGMNLLQMTTRAYGVDFPQPPIDVPLWFVRDLMVMFVLSPVLLWLIYRIRSKWLLLGLTVLMFTPYVGNLSYFMFGMMYGIYRWDLTRLDKYAWLWWAILLTLGWARSVFFSWPLYIFAALPVFYVTGGWLLARGERLKSWLIRLGHATFWLLCLHAPMTTTLTRIAAKSHYFNTHQFFAYLLVIAAATILCLLALYALDKIAPPLARVLSGGRNR